MSIDDGDLDDAGSDFVADGVGAVWRTDVGNCFGGLIEENYTSSHNQQAFIIHFGDTTRSSYS